MILSFSEKSFVDDILSGKKRYTCRKDYRFRWNGGRKIHFWYQNPRNTSKEPYHFGNGVVSDIEPLFIDFSRGIIKIGDIVLKDAFVEQFAIGDGFSSLKEMNAFFLHAPRWEGRLISWDYEKCDWL